MKQNFNLKTQFPISATKLFEWHEEPNAFTKLMPPWEKIEILEQQGGIKNDGQITIKIYQGPISIRWQLEHFGYIKGKVFNDKQIKGPFKSWTHSHIFHEIDDENCYLEENIDYEIPFGFLGYLLASWIIKAKLKKLFDYRHKATYEDVIGKK